VYSPNEYQAVSHASKSGRRPRDEVEGLLHALRELVRGGDLKEGETQAELKRLKSRLASAVRRDLADGRGG
jgi:hypothetical protein